MCSSASTTWGVMDKTTWFLISCAEDDSLAIVDNNAVINADAVNLKDSVTFFFNKKTHIGEIIMIDADRDEIDKELKRRGKKPKRNQAKPKTPAAEGKRQVTRPSRFVPSAVSTPEKRKPKSSKTLNKKFKKAGELAINEKVLEDGGSALKGSPNHGAHSDSSSEDDEVLSMIKEKEEKKTEREALLKEILKQPKKCTEEQSSSKQGELSRQDLEQMLLLAESKLSMYKEMYEKDHQKENKAEAKQVEGVEDPNENEEYFENRGTPSLNNDDLLSSAREAHNTAEGPSQELENSNSDDHALDQKQLIVENHPEDDSQLLGKNCPGQTMILLADDVYCTKICLDIALRQSSKGTHLVRRLLQGVFKPEAILTSTLTGQKPRAAGKNNYEDNEVTGLNPRAINAILSFTKKISKAKCWEKVDYAKLRHALSQKVGELTRKAK